MKLEADEPKAERTTITSIERPRTLVHDKRSKQKNNTNENQLSN